MDICFLIKSKICMDDYLQFTKFLTNKNKIFFICDELEPAIGMSINNNPCFRMIFPSLYNLMMNQTFINRRSEDRIVLDCNNKVVKMGRKEIALSNRELQLLKILVQNKNQIVDRKLLLNEIWSGFGAEENVYITVQKLRNKLEENPKEPKYIITKKGGGYLFRAPAEIICF